MELINFLIAHYYLSAPLLIVIILLLASNSKKGGKKISCQTLIGMSNQEQALIIDIRDSDKDGKIEVITRLDNYSIVSYEVN